jgi:hypothetical protein
VVDDCGDDDVYLRRAAATTRVTEDGDAGCPPEPSYRDQGPLQPAPCSGSSGVLLAAEDILQRRGPSPTALRRSPARTAGVSGRELPGRSECCRLGGTVRRERRLQKHTLHCPFRGQLTNSVPLFWWGRLELRGSKVKKRMRGGALPLVVIGVSRTQRLFRFNNI